VQADSVVKICTESNDLLDSDGGFLMVQNFEDQWTCEVMFLKQGSRSRIQVLYAESLLFNFCQKFCARVCHSNYIHFSWKWKFLS
jgi:hypothetical protein